MSEKCASSTKRNMMFIFALLFVPAVAGIISPSSQNYMLLDPMLKALYGDAYGPRQILCSKTLNVSWLSKPPFTNSSGNSYPYGILHEVLETALNRCGALEAVEEKPCIRYNIPAAANKSTLLQDILHDRAHLILPVHSDDQRLYKGFLSYIKILESPGFALIRKNDSQQSDDKNAILLNAIRGCWPIVMLTLLLSSVAGLCVWVLETKRNSQEFGSPFYCGAFDGFWWAFVTMTTVGYGDKTPKSTVARLFSVLWIMIGVSTTSILTATLSSALTSVTVERYERPSRMRIGVVKDNEIAFQKAVKLGMEVQGFETLDKAHDALVEKHLVDGLLEETFTAMEYLNQKETSLLSIVHLYEEKHGYGFAYFQDSSEKILMECISKVSEFVKDELYRRYSDTVNHYFNRIKKFTKHQMRRPKDTQVEAQNVINHRSPTFIGTVFSLCVVTLLFFAINVALRCCRSECQVGQTRAQEAAISHRQPPWSWDEKYSEILVTELVKAPFRLKTSGRGKEQDTNVF